MKWRSLFSIVAVLLAGSAMAQAPLQKLRSCLSIEDFTKERLNCFDQIIRPEIKTPAPKARNVAECRFLKEEDERLICFNNFVNARTQPQEQVTPPLPPIRPPEASPQAPSRSQVPPQSRDAEPTVTPNPRLSPAVAPKSDSVPTAAPKVDPAPAAPPIIDQSPAPSVTNWVGVGWLLLFIICTGFVVAIAIRARRLRLPKLTVSAVAQKMAEDVIKRTLYPNSAGTKHVSHSKERQLLESARQMFLDTKTDFFRRFTEAPNLTDELIGMREALFANFDPFMEVVLCKIAGADGPINEMEADVLNSLLGKQMTDSYYNGLLDNAQDINATETFGTVVDIAIQLGGVEQGGEYDPKNDPVVKCFETLGQTVLSADKNISQKELACFSAFTTVAHSKAAELDRRIQSSLGGDSDPSLFGTDASEEKKGAAKLMDAPVASLEQCIEELHNLVGLESVKREVETLTNLAKVFAMRKKKGLPIPDVSFHMVFSGNPGTGKTTVARIVSKIYGCLSLLTKGHMIEVDRSGLVGNFIGQTATKTKKVVEQAKGGILFIDEAYALVRGKGSENDYGQEAIEVILKSMEDYRDDLVIIVAGYTDRMETFLASNPGLRSRFPRVVSFPDYSATELAEIFRRVAHHSRYRLANEAEAVLKSELQRLWQQRGPDFANARDVRNLFERVVSHQANRVSGLNKVTTEALTTITEADVRGACA